MKPWMIRYDESMRKKALCRRELSGKKFDLPGASILLLSKYAAL